MLTIEAVRAGLQDRKIETVADKTGLHYQTVWRIVTGNFKNPSHKVIEKLSAYLEGEL